MARELVVSVPRVLNVIGEDDAPRVLNVSVRRDRQSVLPNV